MERCMNLQPSLSERPLQSHTHARTFTHRLQPFPLTFIHHCGVNIICSSVLQTDEGLNDVSVWLLPENSSLNRDLKSFPISNAFLTEIQTKYQITSDQAVCLALCLSVMDSIVTKEHTTFEPLPSYIYYYLYCWPNTASCPHLKPIYGHLIRSDSVLFFNIYIFILWTQHKLHKASATEGTIQREDKRKVQS